MSVKAMKGGAVEFQTKPFRDQDLLDAVQVALDRATSKHTSDKAVSELRAKFETLIPNLSKADSLGIPKSPAT
jgi:FixJ family two-component response regulator